MTPQERELIVDLFDRLASLERNPRDPQAEAAIREGLRDAPNALYALVQTVLVQDEALKAANARIQQYEHGDGPPGAQDQPRGFLDSMRDSLFGRDEPRGSVPRVPQAGAPMGAPPPGYRADPWGRDRDGPPPVQQPYGAPTQQPSGGSPGGSFLGTAAAAAAGVIGGSLLMGGIRSALGGHQAGPFSGAFDQLSGRDPGSPWSGATGGDLSREAGLNDIGGRSSGRFDQAQQDATDDAAADAQDDTDQAQDDAQDAGDDSDTDTA